MEKTDEEHLPPSIVVTIADDSNQEQTLLKQNSEEINNSDQEIVKNITDEKEKQDINKNNIETIANNSDQESKDIVSKNTNKNKVKILVQDIIPKNDELANEKSLLPNEDLPNSSILKKSITNNENSPKISSAKIKKAKAADFIRKNASLFDEKNPPLIPNKNPLTNKNLIGVNIEEIQEKVNLNNEKTEEKNEKTEEKNGEQNIEVLEKKKCSFINLDEPKEIIQHLTTFVNSPNKLKKSRRSPKIVDEDYDSYSRNNIRFIKDLGSKLEKINTIVERCKNLREEIEKAEKECNDQKTKILKVQLGQINKPTKFNDKFERINIKASYSDKQAWLESDLESINFLPSSGREIEVKNKSQITDKAKSNERWEFFDTAVEESDVKIEDLQERLLNNIDKFKSSMDPTPKQIDTRKSIFHRSATLDSSDPKYQMRKLSLMKNIPQNNNLVTSSNVTGDSKNFKVTSMHFDQKMRIVDERKEDEDSMDIYPYVKDDSSKMTDSAKGKLTDSQRDRSKLQSGIPKKKKVKRNLRSWDRIQVECENKSCQCSVQYEKVANIPPVQINKFSFLEFMQCFGKIDDDNQEQFFHTFSQTEIAFIQDQVNTEKEKALNALEIQNDFITTAIREKFECKQQIEDNKLQLSQLFNEYKKGNGKEMESEIDFTEILGKIFIDRYKEISLSEHSSKHDSKEVIEQNQNMIPSFFTNKYFKIREAVLKDKTKIFTELKTKEFNGKFSLNNLKDNMFRRNFAAIRAKSYRSLRMVGDRSNKATMFDRDDNVKSPRNIHSSFSQVPSRQSRMLARKTTYIITPKIDQDALIDKQYLEFKKQNVIQSRNKAREPTKIASAKSKSETNKDSVQTMIDVSNSDDERLNSITMKHLKKLREKGNKKNYQKEDYIRSILNTEINVKRTRQLKQGRTGPVNARSLEGNNRDILDSNHSPNTMPKRIVITNKQGDSEVKNAKGYMATVNTNSKFQIQAAETNAQLSKIKLVSIKKSRSPSKKIKNLNNGSLINPQEKSKGKVSPFVSKSPYKDAYHFNYKFEREELPKLNNTGIKQNAELTNQIWNETIAHNSSIVKTMFGNNPSNYNNSPEKSNTTNSKNNKIRNTLFQVIKKDKRKRE